MSAIIAHLSDPHLSTASDRPRRRLQSVLDHLARLSRVDAIVITGDLADNGLAEEYDQLHRVLATRAARRPVLVTTGNHDRHEPYLRAFGSRNAILDVRGVRIIGLDSSPSHPPSELRPDQGFLDAETLQFAWSAAESSDGPFLIALHHPPMSIGHAAIDATALANPEEISALTAAHSQCAGILTGHLHTAHATDLTGIPVRTAPGIVSALEPFTDDAIRTDDRYPASYAVHTVEPGGRTALATRYYTVPNRTC